MLITLVTSTIINSMTRIAVTSTRTNFMTLTKAQMPARSRESTRIDDMTLIFPSSLAPSVASVSHPLVMDHTAATALADTRPRDLNIRDTRLMDPDTAPLPTAPSTATATSMLRSTLASRSSMALTPVSPA